MADMRQIDYLVGTGRSKNQAFTLAPGSSVNLPPTVFAGHVSGGGKTQVGVVTSGGGSIVSLHDSNMRLLHDDLGSVVMGNLTESAGTWTVNFNRWDATDGTYVPFTFASESMVGSEISISYLEVVQAVDVEPEDLQISLNKLSLTGYVSGGGGVSVPTTLLDSSTLRTAPVTVTANTSITSSSSDAKVSIDGGALQNLPVTVNSGSYYELTMPESYWLGLEHGASYSIPFSIGGEVLRLSGTVDKEPVPFTGSNVFTTTTGSSVSSLVESTVSVGPTGTNLPTPVYVTGEATSQFAIQRGGTGAFGAWRSESTAAEAKAAGIDAAVSSGDRIKLRHTSSSVIGVSTTTTLHVGWTTQTAEWISSTAINAAKGPSGLLAGLYAIDSVAFSFGITLPTSPVLNDSWSFEDKTGSLDTNSVTVDGGSITYSPSSSNPYVMDTRWGKYTFTYSGSQWVVTVGESSHKPAISVPTLSTLSVPSSILGGPLPVSSTLSSDGGETPTFEWFFSSDGGSTYSGANPSEFTSLGYVVGTKTASATFAVTPLSATTFKVVATNSAGSTQIVSANVPVAALVPDLDSAVVDATLRTIESPAGVTTVLDSSTPYTVQNVDETFEVKQELGAVITPEYLPATTSTLVDNSGNLAVEGSPLVVGDSVHNPRLGTYVTVSSATSADIPSDTYDSWSLEPGLNPSSVYFRGIHHNGSNWLLVGDNGYIATSTDGETCSFLVLSSNDTLYDVHYGGGVWVAVGVSGAILRSNTGSTNQADWTKSSITSQMLASVHYANGLWVAVGGGGTILTSPDGTTWESRAAGTSFLFNGVYHNGTYWIAVGQNGTVLKSTNGAFWSSQATPTTDFLYDVHYADSTWVAVGASGTIITSPDGTNWTSRTTGGITANLYGVYYEMSTWIVVGTGIILTSPSPSPGAWSARTVGPAEVLLAVHSDGSKWLAVGNKTVTTAGSVEGQNITTNPVSIVGDTLTLPASLKVDTPEFTLVVGANLYAGTTTYTVNTTQTPLSLTGDYSSWSSVTTGTSNLLYRIYHDNGLWVATADGGNVITSTDGESWTIRSLNIGANTVRGIHSSGTLWVAVGSNGQISTSPDGITWTARTSGTTTQFWDVHYGNGLWVALTAPNDIRTSTDGINWVQRTPGVNDVLHSAHYASGLWVVVGVAGKILTSSDGITWTQRATGTAVTIRDVHYDGTRWVVVGASGFIATSTDGISWTSNLGQTASSLLQATYDGSMWIIVGTGGAVLTSPDGLTWTNQPSLGQDSYGLHAAGGKILATSTSGAMKMALGDFTSQKFTTNPMLTSSVNLSEIERYYVEGTSFAVGDDPANDRTSGTVNIDVLANEVLTGVYDNWAEYNVGDIYQRGMYYGGGRWVVVGDGGKSYSSVDAITWVEINTGSTQGLRSVHYADSLWVAVGGGGTILTSPDSTNWTIRPSGGTNQPLYGVHHSGTQWVAVGNAGTIITSTDGVTWVVRSTPTTQVLYGVHHSGTQWVAVGSNGVVIHSTNGVTWTGGTGLTPTTQVLYGVHHSGTQWVAVGNAGTIITSTDGVTWVVRSTPTIGHLYSVYYDGVHLIAVGGEGTIITSLDGVTWTSRTSGTNGVLIEIIHNGTQWLAAEIGGTVLASTGVMDIQEITTTPASQVGDTLTLPGTPKVNGSPLSIGDDLVRGDDGKMVEVLTVAGSNPQSFTVTGSEPVNGLVLHSNPVASVTGSLFNTGDKVYIAESDTLDVVSNVSSGGAGQVVTLVNDKLVGGLTLQKLGGTLAGYEVTQQSGQADWRKADYRVNFKRDIRVVQPVSANRVQALYHLRLPVGTKVVLRGDTDVTTQVTASTVSTDTSHGHTTMIDFADSVPANVTTLDVLAATTQTAMYSGVPAGTTAPATQAVEILDSNNIQVQMSASGPGQKHLHEFVSTNSGGKNAQVTRLEIDLFT